MLGWKKRRERLMDEFETHIALETQAGIDAGMTADEARLGAQRKFGNVLLAAERSREMWGGLWLERLLLDVRYAVRSLRRVPGYTAMLVGTLVLGLGSVTTMFAVIESTVMRPVALPHPEQLVQIYGEGATNGTSVSPHALSYGAIQELNRDAHAFAGVSEYNTMVRPVRTADGTRVSVLTEVTPNFFRTLGVEPQLGRVIDAGDAQAPVVVVSDEFWRNRLGADPNAVGSSIEVSGAARTVIGVLPQGVHPPVGTGDLLVYIPVRMHGADADDFKYDSAGAIARLKPGVSMRQALAEARSILAHTGQKSAERDSRPAMRSYRDLVSGEVQGPLMALLGAVGVLLLIACANAANLQIGRAAGRMPEMSVRSALGASFRRLLQQLLTESILVSLFSAGVGAVLSFAAITVIRRTYGEAFPRFDELSIHPIVLVGTALLAVVTGVLATIAPAWSLRRKLMAQPGTGRVSRGSRLPGVLVSLQVALTCVLLATCGLFLRTLHDLRHVKLGFDPHGVTTLVLMPENQNQAPEISRQIEARLLKRFAALPGVQSVTLQSSIPFSSYSMSLNGTTDVHGRSFHAGDTAFYSLVSTDFVRASGIRLLRGRGFQPEDDNGAAISVLVNEAFAKKYLGGREAVGTTLGFHRNAGETDADIPFAQPMTVVGVVEDEMQGQDLSAAYEPMVYLDYMQLPNDSLLGMVFSMTAQYAVRSSLAPGTLAMELRAVVKEIAPTMIEMRLRPMEAGIEESLGQRELAMRLVMGFGSVALLLSAAGIYGVLAYAVALRRREIGIRMALGSSREKVAELVVRQAGGMMLLGLVPGIAGAWAAGRAVRSYLFGVSALDLPTLACVGVILLMVSAAASLLPALRAARIDPAETLRSE